MLKRMIINEGVAHRYKDPETLIDPGTYLIWQGKRLDKPMEQLLGGIPATIPGGARFIRLYPDAIYVRRVLTGYLAPESALYGTETKLDPDYWPSNVTQDLINMLRPWQRQFVLDAQAFWKHGLQYRRGMIVRMGGGKTLVGLILAQAFDNPWVLAQRYLHAEWRGEAHKWGLHCPNLSTPESSHKIKDADFLDVDESNSVSNPQAQRTKKVRALSDRVLTAVGGTGTPLSVSPLQVRWLNALKPGVFPDKDSAFQHMYGLDTRLLEVAPGRNAWVTLNWDMDKLAAHASDYAVTVNIADLLDQLPPCTYRTIITPKPKNYDLITSGAATVRGSSKRLMQALMASDGHILTDEGLALDNDDYKLTVAQEIVDNAGEPVFVVAHWQRTLDRLTEALRHHKPAIIGAGQDEAALQRFKLGETSVLICPFELTKGLNLQNCRITLVVSNGTSPLQRDQMEARTFRPGQTRGCVFIDLCAEGTLDERRLRLLMEHRNQTTSFIEAALRKEYQRLTGSEA